MINTYLSNDGTNLDKGDSCKYCKNWYSYGYIYNSYILLIYKTKESIIAPIGNNKDKNKHRAPLLLNIVPLTNFVTIIPLFISDIISLK